MTARGRRPEMSGLRIGVPGGWFLESAGRCRAGRVACCPLRCSSDWARGWPRSISATSRRPHADGYLIIMAELASMQEPDLGRMDEFDLGARARIEQGLTLSATAYIAARCVTPRW